MPTKTKKTPKKKTAKPVNFRNGLDGYLVMWRHTMDDVPVALFANKSDAIEFAETTSFRASYTVAKKLDIDCATPVCFVVCRFVGGKPTEIIYVDRGDDA